MGLLDHLLYGLAWLSFGAGHSLLADGGPGRRLKRVFNRTYRLAYNGFATLHMLAIWSVGRLWLAGDTAGFPDNRLTFSLRLVVGVAAIALILQALRHYDSGRFLGFTQLRARADSSETAHSDEEGLRTSGLHAYMRHPLYTGAMLLLWALATDPFTAATAFWASLYFVIGARIEERRLCARFGDAYRCYRAAVPAFLPWRGRVSI